MVYDYRTEPRTDTFNATTGAGVTTANVVLHDFIYDDDTDTISFDSSIAETPIVSTYNGTTKLLTVASLTANTTRTLEVTYDIDAIPDSAAINTLLDRWAWIWMLVVIVFAPASIAAMWTGRA